MINASTVNGFTVGINVPANAKFTDTNTITTINGKTGAISKADIVALGIPAQDTNTVYSHPTSHPASMITGLPTSLPADGGDADTVNGFTVGVNVPSNAKFTDNNTTYSEITTAEIDAGTASTKRTVTGRRFQYALDKAYSYVDSKVLTDVPTGAKFTDTVYSHPTHPASMITGLPTSLPANGGNASTTTKLQTARKINGVSFDGTADITVADATKEPAFTKNTAFNKKLRHCKRNGMSRK